MGKENTRIAQGVVENAEHQRDLEDYLAATTPRKKRQIFSSHKKPQLQQPTFFPPIDRHALMLPPSSLGVKELTPSVLSISSQNLATARSRRWRVPMLGRASTDDTSDSSSDSKSGNTDRYSGPA